MTTIARVWRGVDLSGSAKARPSAAASCGVCGATMDGPAMSGSSAGFATGAGSETSATAPAVIEIAAETFAAIDGVALAYPEQRHRDVLAHAIDAIVERPGDQACARHRRGSLGEYPHRVEAGDEGLGADHVGDEPVATFGTSRARAAESASALSAVVAARMRMRFRRFTRSLRHDASARAGDDGEAARWLLAGFGNRLGRS
jgi:hypothetical protein